MSATRSMLRSMLAVAAFSAGTANPTPARAAAPASSDEARLATWASIQKMKAMDLMHIIDAERKGFVTKEEFLKFQERFFERMDRDRDGKVDAKEWMGKGTK